MTVDEDEDAEHVAVAHLRQLVDQVGELPARSVTPAVVEALTSARRWLNKRDDFEAYVGG